MLAELVERCIAARNGGADFPTVWQTVLRLDPLVLGVPMQMISDGHVRLEIQLFPGQVLIYDSPSNGYSLSPFPPR